MYHETEGVGPVLRPEATYLIWQFKILLSKLFWCNNTLLGRYVYFCSFCHNFFLIFYQIKE